MNYWATINRSLNLLKADASVVLGSAGETDEVVTIDVRRQIRWPTPSMENQDAKIESPLACGS